MAGLIKSGRGGEGRGVKNLRFAATIAVVVFIIIAGCEILRVLLLDFGVGHVVADTGIEFVEGLPLELVPFLGEVTGCGDGALEG